MACRGLRWTGLLIVFPQDKCSVLPRLPFQRVEEGSSTGDPDARAHGSRLCPVGREGANPLFFWHPWIPGPRFMERSTLTGRHRQPLPSQAPLAWFSLQCQVAWTQECWWSALLPRGLLWLALQPEQQHLPGQCPAAAAPNRVLTECSEASAAGSRWELTDPQRAELRAHLSLPQRQN